MTARTLRESSTGALWRTRGATLILSLGALVRCDCEDIQFVPGATYTPDAVLDFGPVAVNSQKTLPIKVLSSGSAALKLLATNLENGDASKWLYTVGEPLLSGLAPSRTSSIVVTYRPCPAAWETVTGAGGEQIDRLRETFDYNTCPGGSDSAELVTVEVDTRTGGARILLSGQPVQPPVVEIQCQNGSAACNSDMPVLSDCISMVFGNVTAGDPPCDLVVELQNRWRNDKPVGDLNIERIEISVQELQEGRTEDGAAVGFTLHELDGSDLEITPDTPLTVPSPTADSRCGTDGQITQCANRRFKIRFDGSATGTWFGSDSRGMTGVRVYTSDPDQRVVKFNINGIGSAPDIEYYPSQLNFGPVEQNTTKTLTATISNAGDAVLRISEIRFATDTTGRTFTFATSRGNPPLDLPQNDRFGLQVSCTPRTSGDEADVLLIGNNDPKTGGRVEIPVLCGAVPKLRVDPPDVLVFPNPEPPPAPPRESTLTVSNVGYGDLEVMRLEITGPGGDTTSSSIDDFEVVECNGMNPCTPAPAILLCPPSSSMCAAGGSQRALTIRYQNNDISTVDFAELHIRSNDRTDMDHIVVLSAQDIPCLYPTPVITVTTQRPCKGMPVEVTGASSTPGGSAGTMITSYSWSWLFTPASQPAFTMNNAAVPGSSFIPSDAGTYILALDVANDCGQRSQAPSTETINVVDTCN